MTRRQLEQEVARATGESLNTVRSYGFQVEPLPDMSSDDEAGPQIVDWDAVEAQRPIIFPMGPIRRAA